MEILHPALLLLLLPVNFSSVEPSIVDANPNAASLLNLAGRRTVEPPSLETDYPGRWELFAKSSGVSTMHMQITPNNKAIMYDATQFQPTPMQLPVGNCRVNIVRGIARPDCGAHAVEFDFNTAQIRPLKISTNTWCSSGGLDIDGTVVSTGGYEDGSYSVRYHAQCETCDFEEFPKALADTRWYATQVTLADGSFIVVGGRRSFSYEFVPARGSANTVATFLPFLKETTDLSENNLYPIVHLSTDNNLFIFANNRSILLNPHTNTVIREFPPLPGGARNYPATGISALLPIDLRRSHHSAAAIPAEVIICGGARQTAYTLAWNDKTYIPALRNCGRMIITKQNPRWMTDVMPIPRTTSDMLILPNAELLIINGFSRGSAGWECGQNPALAPFLYRPKARRGDRFRTLAPTTIPRMYHSTSAVLPDGSILVAGSNPHYSYNYSSVYPTEFRVEKFYPPYYDPAVASLRPSIYTAPTEMVYGVGFEVEFGLVGEATPEVTVHMYAPPFTTHGISMNQRMVILSTGVVTGAGADRWQVTATAPPFGAVAPPGYYMLFVVNRGLPSVGVWTRIRVQ